MNLKVDDIAGLLKATSFSQSGTFYTFYYTLEFPGDYKYLLLCISPLYDTSTNRRFNPVYKVVHTRGTKVGSIILIVFIAIILLVIVCIMIHCIRKRRAKEVYDPFSQSSTKGISYF